jgi:hypothetical protein
MDVEVDEVVLGDGTEFSEGDRVAAGGRHGVVWLVAAEGDREAVLVKYRGRGDPVWYPAEAVALRGSNVELVQPLEVEHAEADQAAA